MKKRFTSLVVCVTLLCSTIGPVHAAEPVAKKAGQDSKVQALPSSFFGKKAAYTKEMRSTGTESFALKREGDLIDTFLDSKGATQTISLAGVAADERKNTMEFSFGYESSSATQKDSLIVFQYYKDNGDGSLSLCNNGQGWITTGAQEAVLTLPIWKQIYEGQPYVYFTAGLLESEDTTDYTALTLFKVANPYYNQSEDSDGELKTGEYAVISNESVNGYSSQPSGTFKINNSNYTIDKNAPLETYKMDVLIPFDAKKNANKLLKNDKMYSQVQDYQVGDEKEFWVTDITTNADYQISAKLLYSGTHSDVWVNNDEVTQQQAINIGTEFDQTVHKCVTDNFGVESDVNNDGKVNILCFDIIDDYSYGSTSGYVGGYFSAADLYDMPTSNQCEMFYIDTYPSMGTVAGNKDESKCYTTLAHEFQHMVNYNQNGIIEGSMNGMDVWMNEGMSMAAEQIYTNQVLNNRIDYYNISEAIKMGHSVLHWDYGEDTLSNYSLSYLFLQYFKIQAGQGDAIFKELSKERKNTYEDMEKLVKKYIDPNMTFGQFMTNFRLALLLKENTGLRGFKGETGFNSIETPLYEGEKINIRGGGAVVKDIKETGILVPNNKGENITYTIVGEQTNEMPVLSGVEDTTITIGSSFDEMEGVTATDLEDGDLTNQIVVTGTVDTSIANVYTLTYSVTDSDGNTATKDRLVTVKTNEAPVIYGVEDQTILLNSEFDPMEGVTATDVEDGDLTDQIVVTGTVDTNQPATYHLSYKVTDSDGNEAEAQCEITVVSDEAPIINGAEDKTILIHSEFDEMEGVTATDLEDGDLTDQIVVSGEVDTNVEGEYTLTYTVVDSDSHETTVTRIITVQENQKPVLQGVDSITIETKTQFNPLDGVSAIDDMDGNITDRIKVYGVVNSRISGKYSIVYSVKDSNGLVTRAIRKVTVVSNQKPYIAGAKDQIVLKGSSFDPKDAVFAYDREDGDITDKIQVRGTVDTNTVGDYELTYTVEDSDYNTTTVTCIITVSKEIMNFTATWPTTDATSISGKTEPGAEVKAYVNGVEIASTTVTSDGSYRISIPKQAEGTKIVLEVSKPGYKAIYRYVIVR